MIYVEIDELTPCLRDSVTGEIVDTEVIPITRKTVLKKFNKQNGWYINWESLFNESEIYALVISGTYSIQGLIAVHNDVDSKTAFIDWAVASPENNPQIVPEKKYAGVGGHLFAIAGKRNPLSSYFQHTHTHSTLAELAGITADTENSNYPRI